MDEAKALLKEAKDMAIHKTDRTHLAIIRAIEALIRELEAKSALPPAVDPRSAGGE